MSVIVTEAGFAQDAVGIDFLTLDALLSGEPVPETGLSVDFPNDRDPALLEPWLGRIGLIRVTFPAMGDGRGLSIARRLRGMGYAGRLRAKGPMIADQMRAARRVGYDEIELPESVADRQPEDLWKARPALSYRDRVFG